MVVPFAVTVQRPPHDRKIGEPESTKGGMDPQEANNRRRNARTGRAAAREVGRREFLMSAMQWWKTTIRAHFLVVK